MDEEPPFKKARHAGLNAADFSGCSTASELLHKQLYAVRSLLDVYTVSYACTMHTQNYAH